MELVQNVEYFYNQMLAQKIAYETAPATICRLEIIWEKSLRRFWKDVKPSEINQQLVTTFVTWHKENRKGIQLVNVFKYLGNIFAVMVESGAMEIARRPKLELPKEEQKHHAKQKGRYITNEEFQAIVKNSFGWFKLFALIAYTTGMRKMEIGKLEVSRLLRVGPRFVAHLETNDTKTGRARQIPFPEPLTALVEEQLKAGSPYLFHAGDKSKHVKPQAIDQQWKHAKVLAGIVGRMREHDLRHSCATNLAKANISPAVAVTMLGMSLATYQKTYLKLTANDLIAASESVAARIVL